MEIAIVSTDGINVDEHFGRATRFLIYEMDKNPQRLLRVSDVEPLSENDPNHDFNEAKFGALLKALDGCARVYCTKIGEKPAAELKKMNIEPVVYSGPIVDISP